MDDRLKRHNEEFGTPKETEKNLFPLIIELKADALGQKPDLAWPDYVQRALAGLKLPAREAVVHKYIEGLTGPPLDRFEKAELTYAIEKGTATYEVPVEAILIALKTHPDFEKVRAHLTQYGDKTIIIHNLYVDIVN